MSSSQSIDDLFQAAKNANSGLKENRKGKKTG